MVLIKNIILCADDYGLNQSVSEGILQLVAKKRLSAASCMVNVSDWLQRAGQLLPYRDQIDIGLHVNLTEGQSLTGVSTLTHSTNFFFNINQLLLYSRFKKINHQDVVKELNAQLDRFAEAFHQMPDFIDGHQHVHHLPIVRDALLEVYQRRLQIGQSYIRSVKSPWLSMIKSINVKAFVIQITGANQFEKLLKQKNIPYNNSFAGFYDFDPAANYRMLFNTFLNDIRDGGLIMCHPGLLNKQEAIGEARQNELNYFASDQFIQDCQYHQVSLRSKVNR